MGNNIGKKTTLWELLKDTKVEIPIIQRDYAQGREGEASLREKFLKHVLGGLENGSNGIVLDFVYGTEIDLKPKKLNPLDGQQRLTTLFLLHWYLAWKTGNLNEDTRLLNFTYETRVSSRYFCEALIKECSAIEVNDKLSKSIENQSWFFKEYLQDPTISSMLRMLDDIDEKLKENRECKKLWENLTEKKKITFFYLDLKGFKQTDDLYVKMNARGKPLTSFENFKADLENYIRSSPNDNLNLLGNQKIEKYFEGFTYLKEDKTFSRYVEYKLDKEYLDFFWHYTKPTSDDIKNNKEPKTSELFMNFIHTVIINEALANYEYRSDGKSDQDFLNEIGNLRYLTETTFSKFESVFSEYDKNLLNLAIAKLIESLDCLDVEKSIEDKYRFYFKEEEYFTDILNLKKGEEDKITYHNRLLLFAYLRYSMKFKKTGLSDFMRVMRNLILNTQYGNMEVFYKSIKSISAIILSLGENGFLLKEFVDSVLEWKSFNPSQRKEEKIKAHLIKDCSEWKEEIIKAEEMEFFEGQIRIILSFSQKEVDSYQIEDFKKYRKAFSKVFGEKDYSRSFIKLQRDKNSYLWERAVLSKCNYFQDASQNRYNILSRSPLHRYFSWKNLFSKISLTENNTKIFYKIKSILSELEGANTFDILKKLAGENTTLYKYFSNLTFNISSEGFFIKNEKDMPIIYTKDKGNCVKYELALLYLKDHLDSEEYIGNLFFKQGSYPSFDNKSEDCKYISALSYDLGKYQIWIRSKEFDEYWNILGNIFVFKRGNENFYTNIDIEKSKLNIENANEWEDNIKSVGYDVKKFKTLKYTGVLTVEYIETIIDELKGIDNENISIIET